MRDLFGKRLQSFGVDDWSSRVVEYPASHEPAVASVIHARLDLRKDFAVIRAHRAEIDGHRHGGSRVAPGLVWPTHRFVPIRVRSATDFFATIFPQRI